MAGFTLDSKEHTSAVGQGVLQGALEGAGTGAAIGAPVGGYGAIIGAGIGAIAGAITGGSVSAAEDTKAQKDQYQTDQERAASKQNAQITASTETREGGRTPTTPQGAATYFGSTTPGGTGYDAWHGGY